MSITNAHFGLVASTRSRGYHAVYREKQVNHCPGCGRTHWIIGRVSAECAFCTTALPLAEVSNRSNANPVVITHRNGVDRVSQL